MTADNGHYVGRTLALAMAYGVPAVATDLEGLRSLVQHGVTGLSVPPGDSAALARTILELLALRRAARWLVEATQAQLLALTPVVAGRTAAGVTNGRKLR